MISLKSRRVCSRNCFFPASKEQIGFIHAVVENSNEQSSCQWCRKGDVLNFGFYFNDLIQLNN